jgi:transcriptional regulator with XRE-family HTH domain
MEMKIDAKLVRTEREKRAWSQDHLATVSGLGLRTIQRIEATGLASYESIRALSAVLGVSLALAATSAEVATPAATPTVTSQNAVTPTVASPQKTYRQKIRPLLPSMLLAAGFIVGTLAGVMVAPRFWWLGPLLLALATLAARKLQNVSLARGNVGMNRALLIAAAFMLASGMVAWADPAAVAQMLPVLGSGTLVVLNDRPCRRIPSSTIPA